MSSFRFELNKDGVRALLKSSEMKDVLNDYADRAMARGGIRGNGYEKSNRSYPERAGVAINPTTTETRKDAIENNTLLKAIGGKI